MDTGKDAWIARRIVDKGPLFVDNLPALWRSPAPALWSPWTESSLLWLPWARLVFPSTPMSSRVRNLRWFIHRPGRFIHVRITSGLAANPPSPHHYYGDDEMRR
jgi:hypothetical protein